MRTWFALVGAMALVCGVVRGQVVNPRITTDSSIECSSAEAVVKQIIKPGMTDEQKVRACWRFMLDHFYHWYPPREPDTARDVRDFAKMINSYGFGPCFVAAPVQTALWEAAGFRTRSWTITGHAIPEVFYDGAWHMLDPDARAWHRTAAGHIASVEELAKDRTLFTAPKERSTPYYPFGAPDVACKPLDPWGPPSKMMDLYASRRNNYRYNKRAVMGHPMYLTLRSGESIALSADNEGRFYNAGFPTPKLKPGPVDVTGRHTYGNGRLVWEPNLKTIPLEQLLWLGSTNVKQQDGRLMAADPKKPAVAVFRVWSPYVLAACRFSLKYVPRIDAVRDPEKSPTFEVSTDGGRAWRDLPPLLGVGCLHHMERLGDLTPYVTGRYGFLLRFTFKGVEPETLRFDNLFQLAPLALPRLKPGKNRVTVFRGPDEGVVALTLAKGKPAKERYLVESKNIRVNKSVQPVTYKEPAYAVYRLTAPAALTALSIGGNLTMDRGREQHIAASYSLDGGKTWAEVWRVADNSNPQNSQFEEDRRVTFDNAAGAKEALVRFDMVRNSKYFGVNSVRLYAFYRQPQPKDATLAVTLAWQERVGEKWTDREKAVTVAAFPHTFPLTCGGEAVRLKRITLANPG